MNRPHDYLLPAVFEMLQTMDIATMDKRLFQLGYGNGSVANLLEKGGWRVTGVDPSLKGTARERGSCPRLQIENGSAYDDFVGRFGQFPVVVSLEVIEHVYLPRHYARTVFNLLKPGGVAIISTPYHGYIKNLALASNDNLAQHFIALWDHGHIKF